ncbi:MAG: hypothetical protein MUC96_13935 [Myxococcaceae bacterium]|jgi:hypothetical protein|nr:hypothetical protein [Myxococcaceae bacterium]
MSKIQPNTTPTGMSNVTGQGPDEIKALRPLKSVGLDQNVQERLLMSPRLKDERFAASLYLNVAAETGHGASNSAAATQEMNKNLNSLFSSPAASDGVLSWSEVVDMATRQGDPAAKWLMDNRAFFNELPTKAGKHGAVGLDVASIQKRLSEGTVTPPATKRAEGGGQDAAPVKDPRQEALDTNAQIERENKELDKQIKEKTDIKEALLKVTTHGLAGDSYLSKQELLDLLQSTDDGQRKAAEILLKNWDRLPVPKYRDWGGGMNANEMRAAAMTIAGEVDALTARKREPVPVPGPQSSSAPSVGQPNPGGNAAPPTGPGGSSPPVADLPPTQVPHKEISGTGPERLGQVCDNLSAQIDALIKEAEMHPEKAQSIMAKVTKLTNQMQMLSNLMNQIFTMQSNLSKLFSEMSMTSIRNMR